MRNNKRFWLSPAGVVALVFISCVMYFVIIEHKDHILAALPYFIILLCPLMHIFMHGSHKHDCCGGSKHKEEDEEIKPLENKDDK